MQFSKIKLVTVCFNVIMIGLIRIIPKEAIPSCSFRCAQFHRRGSCYCCRLCLCTTILATGFHTEIIWYKYAQMHLVYAHHV